MKTGLLTVNPRMPHPALHVFQGARREFAGKEPRWLDRRGHFDLMPDNGAETERRIIGLVAHQNDKLVTCA